MVPVALTLPQPPVNGMLYVKGPLAVGVPLMVMVLLVHDAETPAGNPLAPDTPELEIPVAPAVVIVMLVNAVLTHKVGALDAEPTVLVAFTVTCLADVAQVAVPQVGLAPGVTKQA